jgi:hypothetical protein
MFMEAGFHSQSHPHIPKGQSMARHSLLEDQDVKVIQQVTSKGVLQLYHLFIHRHSRGQEVTHTSFIFPPYHQIRWDI